MHLFKLVGGMQVSKLPTAIVLMAGLFLLCGCASMQTVQINKNKLPAEPYKTLAAGYSKSYFQSRFMGCSIGYHLAFGPIIGAALWQGISDYDVKNGTRQTGNDYERLLGDFDTTRYFFQQYEQKLKTQKIAKFTFTESPETAATIISCIKGDGNAVTTIKDAKTGEDFPCISAFKLSYGLGARQGNEQLGFRKYYRPYVRVIGSIKKLSTNETLWQDTVIVFADKRYLGGDAAADKINTADLVASMKSVINEAIELTIKSINGDRQADAPVMVDANRSDFEF
ncbi:MAG: hypothetical protein H7831_17590 [Magnetococcus sp. WYHC-3]